MLTTLIIEDEISSQELLKQIIEEYCPNLSFKAVASNKFLAIESIQTIRPDLIFMDINLKDCTAFDVLEQVDHTKFKIIFTTAHDQYAIKAFKYEAVDYLLKPYSPKDVMDAVNRISKQNYSSEVMKQIQSIVNPDRENKHQKIRISCSDGIYFYDVEDIIRFEANGSYARIFTSDGKSNLASKNLKEFERALPSSYFVRTHTSHLVNVQKIQVYKKEDGGFLVMSDGAIIPVSRRKKNALLATLKNAHNNV